MAIHRRAMFAGLAGAALAGVELSMAQSLRIRRPVASLSASDPDIVALRRAIPLMKQAGDWLAASYPEQPVYLLVLEGNAPARRFYERLGGHCAEVSTMETHGGAVVRSCRYAWERPARLSRPDASDR